ncbi:restriction endonuclease subunit S [Rothia nasisuis]|uniref:restriction endonuclease subunit S n=1 Tax=Rothia nasisuis TaxID=2109647 RepID=UPI001F02E5D5|nr:restriction endonuclease subunit S [Rothia nasisuis]
MQKVPLKRLCTIVSGTGFPNSYQGISDESIPFYKVGSLSKINSENYLNQAENTISYDTANALGATLIPSQSSLMAKIGAAVLLKRVAINAQESCIDNNMMAMIPKPNVHPKYLFYLLQTIQLEPLMNPGAVPNLNMEFFRNTSVPYVPWEEQKRIADELDRELAEIDEFISDLLRLQDLLQERLASLTFDLATDASNPDRYETGHPFWKTLPKGWTLQKLGWHFRVGNGSTPLSTNEEYWSDDTDDIPWFNSSTVNQTIAERPSRYVTKKAMQECHLPTVPAGSLLMGMIGQGKTRGMVTKTGIEATLSQNVAYLTPMKNSGLDVDFALLALKAAYPELREINSGNGTTKGSLTCETIQQFRVPTPEFHQQLSLVSNFNIMKSKNTGLINLAKKFELLSEKKSSLVDQFINRR